MKCLNDVYPGIPTLGDTCDVNSILRLENHNRCFDLTLGHSNSGVILVVLTLYCAYKMMADV
jgi:hypothetical protein